MIIIIIMTDVVVIIITVIVEACLKERTPGTEWHALQKRFFEQKR